MHDQNVTTYVRCGTDQDISDALLLADRILPNSEIELDSATLKFSRNLFVAVSMEIAYSGKLTGFDDMLDYLVSGWDNELQIILSFQYSDAFIRDGASKWLQNFNDEYLSTSWEAAELLIKQSHLHWASAMAGVGLKNKDKQPSGSCVQVFNQQLVAKAMKYTSSLRDDKSSWSNRILEDAQKQLGCRTVPDAKQAGIALQEISQDFENLAEPISRLRTSLVLASCMKPEDFHITPILLLGEPGIGKTYLASKLAKAISVPMEKVSAGGAQGGFQITGSHTSWNDARPGVIFTVLAKGESATPVVLIDEVDKIQDGKYPVLPVLLDLLDVETGRHFKDEYFEMQIDASKVIFILTANSIAEVPAPLLSRCEIFNIPRPGMLQRLRIIEGLNSKLCAKTNKHIQLDKMTAKNLAARADVDLRKVTFLVEDAFARAIQTGEKVAYIWQPEVQNHAESMKQPESNRVLH